MAFWKKSEDPWDIDPEKRRRERPAVTFETTEEPEEKEDGESILAEIAGLFKKKDAEEPAQPPMICPWCGQEMVKNYLSGGRDHVVLVETKPGAFLGTTFMDTTLISDEGGWDSYKSCWRCIPCRKLVVDMPEKKEETFTWDGNPPSADRVEQNMKEETS